MTTSVTEAPPAPARTANQRLKDGWDRALRRSTLLAALLHVMALGLVPAWARRIELPEQTRTEGVSLVALPPLDARSSESGAPAAPLPAIEEETEASDDEGLDDGALASDPEAELAELRDAIGARLLRRGGLVPSLARPADAPEAPEEAEEGDDTEEESELEVGGEILAVELTELPEMDPLDTDRLSSIRPELALQMPSAWVLIRNPNEVEAFLRRGYASGLLDPAARGSVSVTLWIDPRGRVQWAEVSESSGFPQVDEYALALFNEVAAFRAAREDGVSVSRSVTLSLTFPW